ncbi:MAG TPA: ATP-dependent Clp protease proteolytic subunit [Streptosporangiaceae bacterium]|nr:ATP-dependent Clp protease proteolytic subunit [Streptosporangiaceae bacterium]
MAENSKTPTFNWTTREQLLNQRILVLDGTLDDDNGTLLLTQFLSLAAADPDAGIALWIHSPGGSIPAMLAIRDVMRLIPCEVSTLAMGWAASAGQFLLSAGAKGRRFALPHARILMHQGSAGIGGSAVEVELQADDLRHTVRTVLGAIAEDIGQPFERVYEDSLHDKWYTAAEALDYGFIDHVVSSFSEVMPRRRHKIGISALCRRTPFPTSSRSTRAVSGSWMSTRICSPSGSCTWAPPSTQAWRTR